MCTRRCVQPAEFNSQAIGHTWDLFHHVILALVSGFRRREVRLKRPGGWETWGQAADTRVWWTAAGLWVLSTGALAAPAEWDSGS